MSTPAIITAAAVSSSAIDRSHGHRGEESVAWRPPRSARWRGRLCTCACAASLVILAAGNPCAAAPVTHVVVIEQMQFHPAMLAVHRGDRVKWVNKDLFPHTATASSHTFDSGEIASGSSWTYVSGPPGTYPYICKFHPTMHGTLKVQ